ncbi:MAG: ATP-dependent protease ATPase subunit HslU, partial [Anaplasmataceae bacterium]|nr:ATP-dependent protease ATPase subunit HslU [Anaplasmataceae bacterium]
MTNNFDQLDNIISKNKNIIEMGGGKSNATIDTSCALNSMDNCDNSEDEDDEIEGAVKEVDIANSSPREIVKALDRYIIGQVDAKSSVAIAIRNRVRRMKVPMPLRDDILPKNILMIGPTGVGKTEIARRIAQMAKVPFLKVEATKFTEVGYVGRDVDSIIRDLMDNAVNLIKNRQKQKIEKIAKKNTKILILNTLIGSDDVSDETKKIFIDKLNSGKFDETLIEIEVTDTGNAAMPIDMPGGMQMGMVNLGEMMGKFFGGKKTKKRKVKVKDAWKILTNEETNKLIDEESIINEAKELTINSGIVVIDEIDKIASRTEVRGEVNREGVQRDLLPLIEGTSVATKYGVINTDHILFIASGAFHMAKPSDLLPELQGRFPVRV